MTEGIIDITPHLPAAEVSLEDAFALAAAVQEEEANN